jgi:hypothetical protein
MAVCQFCGIDSPGDSRFCGVCGRPFTNEHDASTSRSSTNSPVSVPPPPPPPILQRSSVPSPYPQGNGPSFIAPVAPVTPSMSQNAPPPPPPPSGMLSQPPQPPTIRQSYPGQASGSGQQPPTIRQSYPGTSEPGQQPPTIRQSFPSSGGTPPPTAPVNNQSPMFLPPANSGETYNTPGMGNSSQYDGGNQKLQQKKRSSGLRLLTIAIILVIVLIGGVGSVLAYSYLHNNKPSGGSAAVATATPAPTVAATLAPTPTAIPTANATTAASATPVATLTPTVVATVTATAPTQTGIIPQSPALPLTIPCVNCTYPKLTLVLSSITPDQANPSQTTDWNFTITNNGSSSCSSVNFSQIQLEDPSMTYQGQGQAGDTWTMNTSQQQIESPSFQIVPNPGVRYTLNMSISINNCNDGTGTTNTYQTESLTF